MKWITFALLLLFCFNPGYAIDEYVMPFGAYDLDTAGVGLTLDQHLDELHDSLGFNIFWDDDFTGVPDIREFGRKGISFIKNNDQHDSVGVYTFYNYAVMLAGSTKTQIRMYGGGPECGGDFIGDCWKSDSGSSSFLFGPHSFSAPCKGFTPWNGIQQYIKLERKYSEWTLPSDRGNLITYHVSVRSKISYKGEEADVCSLKVTCETYRGPALKDSLLAVIKTSDFDSADKWQWFTGLFEIPEWIYYRDNKTGREESSRVTVDAGVKLKIITTGERYVYVDSIKIYDQVGLELVENDTYVKAIEHYINNFAHNYTELGDTLWGWYFRDEPYFAQIPLMDAVLKTTRKKGNPDWQALSAINHLYNYDYWFEQIDDIDQIAPDIYPFAFSHGSDSITFTGYDEPAESADKYYFNAGSKKMQNRLDFFAEECSQAYQAAHDNDADFWIMPQCFGGGPQKKGIMNWRKTTGPELRCISMMSLAKGARGIIFWKYGVSCGGHKEGMYDCKGNKTDLWYAVKDNINPYIKAIDSVFMGLQLEKSYAVPPAQYQKPVSDRGIQSINAVSGSSAPNPDLGWFQIGEYTDGNDKYVMIVNRACSQGPENPDPAPPVTATIEFDAANLGLGDFVGIIDLAKSVEYISYDSVLVSADTTYALSRNGVITFSADFEAGEGRLFKLAD